MPKEIKINKSDLIKRIEQNKIKAKESFDLAVEAYKIEAKDQLEEQLKLLSTEELDVSLELTLPVDRTEEFDNLLELFNWEISETVELTKQEFDAYVLDKTHTNIQAQASNSFYLHKLGR